jgi:outer membrane receptor protein involved in Fe transport
MRADANLRSAYSRSLNRPEFRELADVLYYDFDEEQNVIGNPNLQRALIDNYDVRGEWFPGVGEVLAASVFYKHFKNAIEEELLPSPERYVRTWFNSPRGENYGYELEARKSMGFIRPALQGLSLTGNYTRIWSAIEYTEEHTDDQGNAIIEQRERVMQGQSPWTVNASVLWVVPRSNTSANVLYGKVGRRLRAVGDSRDEDVYEESRDQLDLALTQHFWRRYEAKFTVQNLLGDDKVLTSGPERTTWAALDQSPIYSLTFALGL